MIIAGLDLSKSPDQVGAFVIEGTGVIRFFDQQLFDEIMKAGQLELYRLMLKAARPHMSKRAFYRHRGMLKREFGL